MRALSQFKSERGYYLKIKYGKRRVWPLIRDKDAPIIQPYIYQIGDDNMKISEIKIQNQKVLNKAQKIATLLESIENLNSPIEECNMRNYFIYQSLV